MNISVWKAKWTDEYGNVFIDNVDFRHEADAREAIVGKPNGEVVECVCPAQEWWDRRDKVALEVFLILNQKSVDAQMGHLSSDAMKKNAKSAFAAADAFFAVRDAKDEEP